MKKIVSIFLIVFITLSGYMPALSSYSIVRAQESTPEASPDPTPTPLASPEPTPLASTPPEAEAGTPTPTATSTPQATATPAPTYSPLGTPPPLTSPEYDIWKLQKKELKEQKNAREAEWEAHEEDKAWIAAHGGNEAYFVSGAFTFDQKQIELAKVAEAQAFALAAAASPGPCQNQQGGGEGDAFLAASSNSSSSSEGSALNSSANNCADLNNLDSIDSVSGQNIQIENDKGVSLLTGSADAAASVINSANINSNKKGSGQSAGTNDSENLSAQENSENLAVATKEDTLNIDNVNDAFVNNDMEYNAISGENQQYDNDGSIATKTGDVSVIANLLNILNLNMAGTDFMHTIVNALGNYVGNMDLSEPLASYDGVEVTARNESTEEDTKNEATASLTKTTDVRNDNLAFVSNDLSVDAVSGDNNVLGNDGDSDLLTGDVSVLANIMNFINSNATGDNWKFMMVNVLGDFLGNLYAPDVNSFLNGPSGPSVLAENTSTGGDSQGTATATSDSITNVENNNRVAIANNINVEGISGENRQDLNGGASMETGMVDTSTKLTDILNLNVTGNNWVLVIVNVFGKWMGKVVGTSDVAIDAPQDGTYSSLLMGDGSSGPNVVEAKNNMGEDADSTASASLTERTDVVNNNTAFIENNIDILGNSGRNLTDRNDGVSKVKTGFVDLSANLMNLVNSNFTGNNWLVVVLNVFGDFMGNVVFGDHPALASAPAENTGNNNSSSSSTSNSATTISSVPVVQPVVKKPLVLSTKVGISSDVSIHRDSSSSVFTGSSTLTTNTEVNDGNFFDRIINLIKYFINGVTDVLFGNLAYINDYSVRG